MDAFSEEFHVGDKEVVSDKLSAFAKFFRQDFPSVPVVFRTAVFDGDDGIFFLQFHIVVRQLCGGSAAAVGFLENIQPGFRFIKFGGSHVQGNGNVLPEPVTGLVYRLGDAIQGVFRRVQPGGEAAFVAHGGGKAAVMKNGFQRMENFRAITQGFPEGGSAGRDDHEFLEINRRVGVGASVDDVHHRNGKDLGVRAAQVAVQGLVQLGRRRFGKRQGNTQNGVGPQFGLVECAVQGIHEGIRRGLFRGFQTDQGRSNDVTDVVYGLGDSLALVAGCVAVPEFPGFMFPGGSSAGDARRAYGASFQINVRLNGGVAA